MKVNEVLNRPVDASDLRYVNELYTPVREYKALTLHEALKMLHDKKNGVIAIASTETDPKKASSETYRNKNTLKSAGFRWSGGNWIIDDTEFETAKEVLTRINKTDYLISKLEDVQDYVGDATSDPKKSILTTKIQDYIDQLASETDEAAASEEIRRYLNFFSNFHQYSFYNRILIYIQNPNATKVASYKNWKAKHRQVKKGSRGMSVLVPIFPKGHNPLKTGDEDDKKRQPIKFIVGSVFDIADTESIDERGDIPDEPEWWGNQEPSETADALYDLVVKAATSEGIDVTNDAARHGEHGFSEGGHINITSDIAGAGKVSTMVHEYAHELMHWDGKSKFFVGEKVRRDRAVCELQAESVSYVVMKHYGIPVQHHTKYLALWKANSDRVRANMESISKVAHHIINKIDKAQAGSDVAPEAEAEPDVE